MVHNCILLEAKRKPNYFSWSFGSERKLRKGKKRNAKQNAKKSLSQKVAPLEESSSSLSAQKQRIGLNARKKLSFWCWEEIKWGDDLKVLFYWARLRYEKWIDILGRTHLSCCNVDCKTNENDFPASFRYHLLSENFKPVIFYH